MLAKDIDALYYGGEIFQKGVSYEVASLKEVKIDDLTFVDLTKPTSSLTKLPTATKLTDIGTTTRRYNHMYEPDTNDYDFHEIVFYQPLFLLKNKVGKRFYIAHIQLNHGHMSPGIGGSYYQTETVGIIMI